MADPVVCHIPPEQPHTQPSPQSLPAIPPAQPTIASLTATVNAMRQVILLMTGRQGPQGPRGAAGQTNNAKSDLKNVQFTEQARVVETVRVFNPNDKTQYVDVERVNKLVMVDKKTGQKWVWNR